MACTCRKTFRSMKWASIQPMLIEKKWPSKSLVSLRSYPLSTYFRTCAYQGVRNNSFSENFEYLLNGWPLDKFNYTRSLQYVFSVHFTMYNLSANPLSTNPIKWSNTLKQLVGNSQRIVGVCLTILWVDA